MAGLQVVAKHSRLVAFSRGPEVRPVLQHVAPAELSIDCTIAYAISDKLHVGEDRQPNACRASAVNSLVARGADRIGDIARNALRLRVVARLQHDQERGG